MKKPSPTKKLHSKLLSFYYGNPAKDLKIIVITSNTPTPLSTLVHNIITSSGEKSATIKPTSTLSLHRSLSKAWRAGANFIVIDASANIIEKNTFCDLPISVLVSYDISSPQDISPLLSRSPDFLILDRDNASYPVLKDTKSTTATKTFGHHRESDTRIDNFKPYKTAIEARLTLGNRILDVAAFLTGDTAPSLLAAATTVADLLGLDKDTIVDGLASYEP